MSKLERPDTIRPHFSVEMSKLEMSDSLEESDTWSFYISLGGGSADQGGISDLESQRVEQCRLLYDLLAQ